MLISNVVRVISDSCVIARSNLILVAIVHKQKRSQANRKRGIVKKAWCSIAASSDAGVRRRELKAVDTETRRHAPKRFPYKNNKDKVPLIQPREYTHTHTHTHTPTHIIHHTSSYPLPSCSFPTEPAVFACQLHWRRQLPVVLGKAEGEWSSVWMAVVPKPSRSVSTSPTQAPLPPRIVRQ
jgi:hypothetical protein